MPGQQRGKRGRTSTRAMRVMVVDDHPLWLSTVREVLEHGGGAKVVAECADGEEAVRRSEVAKPEVVVMDIDLPGVDGIETTRRILLARPEAKVLVLSASQDPATVVEAARAGASGYLVKNAGASEISDAVRRIHAGEAVFPLGQAEALLGAIREGARLGERLRLVVADDAAVRREGVARVLAEAGLEVVGSGPLSDLRAAVDEHRPDVSVVSVGAGAGAAAGMQALEELREQLPDVRVLVLAEDPETPVPIDVLGDPPGRLGYLLSARLPQVADLVEAIRRLARGESVVDPEIVRRLVARPRERSPIEDLTEGEREVLALMAEGRSNQAISESLFLSPRTVENRVTAIFSKLGLEAAPDDHRRVLAVLAYLRSS